MPLIEDAARLMTIADIFLLVGTSLQVYPAAGLIHEVPAFVPKYIIDKKIPYTTGLQNVVCIEESATVGIQQFVYQVSG